ncbi:unnamed protein product [Amoebophrya sp. A120]|nr:unnamed protein product [Amoebophrya sp. A120]|eukprot:GSA120T00015842001.1
MREPTTSNRKPPTATSKMQASSSSSSKRPPGAAVNRITARAPTTNQSMNCSAREPRSGKSTADGIDHADVSVKPKAEAAQGNYNTSAASSRSSSMKGKKSAPASASRGKAARGAQAKAAAAAAPRPVAEASQRARTAKALSSSSSKVDAVPSSSSKANAKASARPKATTRSKAPVSSAAATRKTTAANFSKKRIKLNPLEEQFLLNQLEKSTSSEVEDQADEPQLKLNDTDDFFPVDDQHADDENVTRGFVPVGRVGGGSKSSKTAAAGSARRGPSSAISNKRSAAKTQAAGGKNTRDKPLLLASGARTDRPDDEDLAQVLGALGDDAFAEDALARKAMGMDEDDDVDDDVDDDFLLDTNKKQRKMMNTKAKGKAKPKAKAVTTSTTTAKRGKNTTASNEKNHVTFLAQLDAAFGFKEGSEAQDEQGVNQKRIERLAATMKKNEEEKIFVQEGKINMAEDLAVVLEKKKKKRRLLFPSDSSSLSIDSDDSKYDEKVEQRKKERLSKEEREKEDWERFERKLNSFEQYLHAKFAAKAIQEYQKLRAARRGGGGGLFGGAGSVAAAASSSSSSSSSSSASSILFPAFQHIPMPNDLKPLLTLDFKKTFFTNYTIPQIVAKDRKLLEAPGVACRITDASKRKIVNMIQDRQWKNTFSFAERVKKIDGLEDVIEIVRKLDFNDFTFEGLEKEVEEQDIAGGDHNDIIIDPATGELIVPEGEEVYDPARMFVDPKKGFVGHDAIDFDNKTKKAIRERLKKMEKSFELITQRIVKAVRAVGPRADDDEPDPGEADAGGVVTSSVSVALTSSTNKTMAGAATSSVAPKRKKQKVETLLPLEEDDDDEDLLLQQNDRSAASTQGRTPKEPPAQKVEKFAYRDDEEKTLADFIHEHLITLREKVVRAQIAQVARKQKDDEEKGKTREKQIRKQERKHKKIQEKIRQMKSKGLHLRDDWVEQSKYELQQKKLARAEQRLANFRRNKFAKNKPKSSIDQDIIADSDEDSGSSVRSTSSSSSDSDKNSMLDPDLEENFGHLLDKKDREELEKSENSSSASSDSDSGGSDVKNTDGRKKKKKKKRKNRSGSTSSSSSSEGENKNQRVPIPEDVFNTDSDSDDDSEELVRVPLFGTSANTKKIKKENQDNDTDKDLFSEEDESDQIVTSISKSRKALTKTKIKKEQNPDSDEDMEDVEDEMMRGAKPAASLFGTSTLMSLAKNTKKGKSTSTTNAGAAKSMIDAALVQPTTKKEKKPRKPALTAAEKENIRLAKLEQEVKWKKENDVAWMNRLNEEEALKIKREKEEVVDNALRAILEEADYSPSLLNRIDRNARAALAEKFYEHKDINSVLEMVAQVDEEACEEEYIFQVIAIEQEQKEQERREREYPFLPEPVRDALNPQELIHQYERNRMEQEEEEVREDYNRSRMAREDTTVQENLRRRKLVLLKHHIVFWQKRKLYKRMKLVKALRNVIFYESIVFPRFLAAERKKAFQDKMGLWGGLQTTGKKKKQKDMIKAKTTNTVENGAGGNVLKDYKICVKIPFPNDPHRDPKTSPWVISFGKYRAKKAEKILARKEEKMKRKRLKTINDIRNGSGRGVDAAATGSVGGENKSSSILNRARQSSDAVIVAGKSVEDEGSQWSKSLSDDSSSSSGSSGSGESSADDKSPGRRSDSSTTSSVSVTFSSEKYSSSENEEEKEEKQNNIRRLNNWRASFKAVPFDNSDDSTGMNHAISDDEISDASTPRSVRDGVRKLRRLLDAEGRSASEFRLFPDGEIAEQGTEKRITMKALEDKAVDMPYHIRPQWSESKEDQLGDAVLVAESTSSQLGGAARHAASHVTAGVMVQKLDTARAAVVEASAEAAVLGGAASGFGENESDQQDGSSVAGSCSVAVDNQPQTTAAAHAVFNGRLIQLAEDVVSERSNRSRNSKRSSRRSSSHRSFERMKYLQRPKKIQRPVVVEPAQRNDDVSSFCSSSYAASSELLVKTARTSQNGKQGSMADDDCSSQQEQDKLADSDSDLEDDSSSGGSFAWSDCEGDSNEEENDENPDNKNTKTDSTLEDKLRPKLVDPQKILQQHQERIMLMMRQGGKMNQEHMMHNKHDIKNDETIYVKTGADRFGGLTKDGSSMFERNTGEIIAVKLKDLKNSDQDDIIDFGSMRKHEFNIEQELKRKRQDHFSRFLACEYRVLHWEVMEDLKRVNSEFLGEKDEEEQREFLESVVQKIEEAGILKVFDTTLHGFEKNFDVAQVANAVGNILDWWEGIMYSKEQEYQSFVMGWKNIKHGRQEKEEKRSKQVLETRTAGAEDVEMQSGDEQGAGPGVSAVAAAAAVENARMRQV